MRPWLIQQHWLPAHGWQGNWVRIYSFLNMTHRAGRRGYKTPRHRIIQAATSPYEVGSASAEINSRCITIWRALH